MRLHSALDYLDWRGDLSFSSSPFNEVDLFICSQLSTVCFDGLVDESDTPHRLSDVIDSYFQSHDDNQSLGLLQSEFIHRMLRKLRQSVRFSDVLVSNAVSRIIRKADEQFSAVTLTLSDSTICISYRGTDDTIIGWKEDCNLCVMPFVPAQQDAIDYLTSVSQTHTGKVRICGHSKGGNLAISAACGASEEISERIIEAVSFDGPGFMDEFFKRPSYSRMERKITTVLSQNSLVGVLMRRAGRTRYVRASIKGPYAHDGFYWDVLGNSFVSSEGLCDFSKAFDSAVNSTITKMSPDERRAFIDQVFDILMSKGSDTLTELTKLSPVEIITMLSRLSGDRKIKEFNRKMISALTKELL